MTKKIFVGAAVLAMIVALAPSASAACIPDKSAYTYNFATGVSAYWFSPGQGSIIGQYWQLGNFSGANSGGCLPGLPQQGLYYSPSIPNAIGLQASLGSCGVGCPANGSTLVYVAQNVLPDHTDFIVGSVAETPAGAVNFDYSALGNQNMIAMPRPRITSSSRDGTTVNFNVGVDATSAGAFGSAGANVISGYKVLSAQASSDPGRNATAYGNVVATFSVTGGAAAPAVAGSVNCTNTAQDQWLVTQVLFDNNTASSAQVSAATRVGCNPALANPQFKIIDKKPADKGLTTKH